MSQTRPVDPPPWINTYVTGKNLNVTPTAVRSRAPEAWFLAWFAAGVLAVFTLLGAFTIGLFVLPISIAVIAFLASRRGAVVGIAGLISGLGLPLLYVGFLNRHGPGVVCVRTNEGGSCTQELSPWPWVLLGVALVVVGLGVFVFTERQRSTATS